MGMTYRKCITPKKITPEGHITNTFAMSGLTLDIAKAAQREIIRLEELLEGERVARASDMAFLRGEIDRLMAMIVGRP